MAKWLFKSEPDVFGWDDLVAKGNAGEEWDGVRNYQARNFMRDMAVGDEGFFYHSRSGLEIVGILAIKNAAHPDSTIDDARWECVDVQAVRPFAKPVTLDETRHARFDQNKPRPFRHDPCKKLSAIRATCDGH